MVTANIVSLSDTNNYHRIDPDFYRPEYYIDFTKGTWISVKKILDICQYGISQAMAEEPVGYPIFKMDDIVDSFLVNDNIKYVEITKNIFSNFKLNTDDILFNRVNAEEFVGRTGIFKLKGDYVFASYLIRLRLKSNCEILPGYFNIFLNSKYGKKQIHRYLRRAVNQANVNANELKNFKIAALPISFQEMISKLINEAWNRIEQSKLFYSQAENLLINELDLYNFKIRNKNCYSYQLSDINLAHRIDPEYFNPGYIELLKKVSKKCEMKPLNKVIVNFKKGVEVGGEKYKKEGFPFIRVSSISKEGFIDKDQKYISEEDYLQLKNKFEPKGGEILLTKDATPGLAYYVKEPIKGIVSSGIIRLNVKDINPEYLCLCINVLIGQSQIERDGGGSVIIHWKPSQIKKLQIPILPKPIQDKIAELVQQSHEARIQGKQLLGKAKKMVEDEIEKAK